MHPNYLREGLDRFCQFFAAPRFAWGSSEREVKAIESEFQQAKTSDSNREAQVHAALIDEAHPYNTFGWGDRRSLVERPAAARVDMQREMRQFHAQHYSAGRMSAVVLGKEPTRLRLRAGEGSPSRDLLGTLP